MDSLLTALASVLVRSSFFASWFDNCVPDLPLIFYATATGAR